MEIGSDYYIAWSLYLLMVVSSHVLFWRLLLKVASLHLKIVLQLGLLTLLITPALLDAETGYWVPAFMVMIMEGLNDGFDAIVPRLPPMFLLFVVLLVVAYLVRWIWSRFMVPESTAQ